MKHYLLNLNVGCKSNNLIVTCLVEANDEKEALDQALTKMSVRSLPVSGPIKEIPVEHFELMAQYIPTVR